MARRFLVFGARLCQVLDQMRPGDVQFTRLLCSERHQLLICQMIERADIANLAPIYDQAEYFCFAEGRRRHR